jgi:hypothetical protein
MPEEAGRTQSYSVRNPTAGVTHWKRAASSLSTRSERAPVAVEMERSQPACAPEGKTA